MLVLLRVGGRGILSSAIEAGATAERFRFAIAREARIRVGQFGFIRSFLETQNDKLEARKRLCIRGGLRWLKVMKETKESHSEEAR